MAPPPGPPGSSAYALPVKLVSVLVLPNTLSCSSVSFRNHWMSVTVSLVRVVARHTNAAEPSGKAMDTGGLTNTVQQN